VIRPIAPDCRTDLPAGFFHFVFTHYVLEHVADIDAVTREIARLTAPGGCGFQEIPVMLFQTVEILVRKPRDAHTAIAR
jgi:2-polyprenyl-3-methyl-5-hydroxy-6-metoxy-1,4-benzoquinol methylase